MNPNQPIQPLSNRREINVVEPVSPALEHVKRMLFQPFDLGKWFIVGFCAWLAYLGEAGGGTGNFNTGNHSERHGTDFHHDLDRARDYLLNNLDWIIPLAALVLFLGLVLGLFFLWLNCRGKFMFLHCVALNRAEVAEPWTRFAAEANSLFWFRLVLGLVGMVLTLPLLGIVIVLIVEMVYHGQPDVAAILTAIGFGTAFLLLAMAFVLIKKFMVDFVVPIMWLRRSGCLAAWKEFSGLCSSRPWQFVLYILFQFVLGLAIGALVLAAVLVTCCCAGCLMALPYLGTVVLLPVLVFKRAYPLYFLAQFGPEYDVFPPPPPPPAMAPPSPGLPPMPIAPPAR